MTTDTDLSATVQPTRRTALALLAGSVATLAAPGLNAASATGAPLTEGSAFSFDLLAEAMRDRATRPDPGASKPPMPIAKLDYDGWRKIAFRPDAARWTEPGVRFRLHAFHRGWLFPEAVSLYDVSSGTAQPMRFTSDDFEYRQDMAGKVAPGTELEGVAGWRLLAPLNSPDRFDELVAFLGASYFRALGQGSVYGASARGLAIDTATGSPEEFPRFSAFYLERPAPGSDKVIVNAALDSRRATGAMRFVITPGPVTEMEITLRLFGRERIDELGIAPLTSMFLYDRTTPIRFNDYRPQVHDSDGLGLGFAGGQRVWRSLANPPRLGESWFKTATPESFGLYQRDRNFADYSDAEARYEKRPSMEVRPLNDWGEGHVRLIEIPTRLETTDNIVAYWRPDGGLDKGGSAEYRYLLRWGSLDAQDQSKLATVAAVASGDAGVAGVEETTPGRKFVIDFAGGRLEGVDDETAVTPVVTVTGAETTAITLHRIPGTPLWRLAFDVLTPARPLVELTARLEGFDSVLSETWSYQWMT